MKTRTPQVFISFTKDGNRTASRLARHIEKSLGVLVWVWNKELTAGDPIISEFSRALMASDFFVPILSPNYSGRTGTEKELRLALEKENRLQKRYGTNTKFIIPYVGNWEIELPLAISEKLAAKRLEDVSKAIERSMERFNLEDNPFSFREWPEPFISTNGTIDSIIVIGHSGKESQPNESDLKDFKYLIDFEETIRPQSLRPAEYLPNIISYLYNKSIAFQKKVSRTNEIAQLTPISCHIDWHLFKYRKELIRSSNIISLGAGDTNLLSRWVLSYYQQYLPVRFDTPAGSQTIFCDSVGKLESFTLDQIESGMERYGAILLIVPNPLNKQKAIIIAAGLTALGTQAALLALSDPLEKLCSSNTYYNYAVILQGVEDNWRAIDYVIIR